MSKGLDAIRQYKQVTCRQCQYHYGGECNNKDECFSMIIERELIERELAVDFVNRVYDIIGGENDTDIIIDTIEKQKKALEIIKNKNVSAYGIKYTKNVHDYNLLYASNGKEQLTQEEYDLLKEVLSWKDI